MTDIYIATDLESLSNHNVFAYIVPSTVGGMGDSALLAEQATE